VSGEVREQTDLATWLLACVTEDEEVIRRNLGERGLGDSGSFPDYQTYSDSDTEAANDYLGRFPPPRLLAECDTKRRIIADAQSFDANPNYSTDGECMAWSALLSLALVYRDRPGYRPEWSPDGR
jgi:hypothetical protein